MEPPATSREPSARDFQNLFEAAPGLYLVLDPSFVIVAVTDAYLTATMTRRAEILGRHVFDVFPDNPDDPGATGVANLRASLERVRTARVADTMAVQKYDVRRPAADGGAFEERYWSPVNTPVLDAEGRLRYIVHEVQDVTEFVRLKASEVEHQHVTDELRSRAARMEAEVLARAHDIAEANRALQRANLELDRFFSLSSDMFGVFNLDGTFRRVNDAWAEVLGYRSVELVGRPFLDLVHADDRERTIAAFERATTDGVTITRFENRYRHQDGSYRWLEWTGRLIPDEDVHYSAARDVTERRQIELALEQARVEAEQARSAAEQASLAKSEFLSRMSHELRTPLNAVLGFGQLLELDELTDEQQENVRYILRAGRHLLDLINEVLDLSRIESGQMTISPEPVAVADLVDEVVGLIRPMADARSIAIHAPGSGCPEHVRADRQRLKQVLLNLMSNAVKYNREGGRLAIDCAPVTSQRLRLSVSDTGFGIAADHLDRLFRPFERLQAGQHIEGTGIGLVLSRGLVEAMGGSIGVTSNVGSGTTFWVELPITTGVIQSYEERLATRATTPPVLPPGLTSILHIEDNLSNLRLVERILAGRDITLLAAMQGSLGIEIARRHRPDLILLDLHLPDLPGREVLRRLATTPETRSIPVIVISADATLSQVSAVMNAGAAGYVTKPIDVAEFLAAVAAALVPPS